MRLHEGLARLRVCVVAHVAPDVELLQWVIERLEQQCDSSYLIAQRNRCIRRAAEFLSGSTWARACALVEEAKAARFAKSSATACWQLRNAAAYAPLPKNARQFFRIISSTDTQLP